MLLLKRFYRWVSLGIFIKKATERSQIPLPRLGEVALTAFSIKAGDYNLEGVTQPSHFR